MRVGLTGGIGSGKSTCADWLKQHGFAVFDADVIAAQLTGPQGAALAAIHAQFGAEFIDEQGLVRARMRELIFQDPAQKSKLEAILHPLIRQTMLQQLQQDQSSHQLLVVPLLAEHGSHWVHVCERVLVVDCDQATQLQRICLRPGIHLTLAQQIIQSQASRAQRLAVASDIVVNDSHTSLAQLQSQLRLMVRRWDRLLLGR